MLAMMLAAGVPVRGDTGSSLTEAEANAVVADHNRIRAEALPFYVPLSWDNGLAAHAQAWADHLAAWNPTDFSVNPHRPYNPAFPVGENIAAFWGRAGSGVDAVRLWETEKPLYSGEAMTWENIQTFGHYTQIIWDRTTRVGCGRAVSRTGSVFIVCNYSPPGNVIGETPIVPRFPDGGGDVVAHPMNVVNQTGHPLRFRFYVAANGPLRAYWSETFTLGHGEQASYNLTPGSTLQAVEAFGAATVVSVAIEAHRTHYALPQGAASMGPDGVVQSSFSMSWWIDRR